MDWKDLGKILAGVGLPLLGAALPIPGGAALGTALAAAIGSDATPDAVASALTLSAEARVKAQEFQLTHHERMTQMLLEYQTKTYATEVDDRKDARKAAVDGGNARRVFWFAVLIFVGVISVEGGVLLFGLPPGADLATSGRVLGSLDAAMLVALYYIFGSSSGSARKTELSGPVPPGR